MAVGNIEKKVLVTGGAGFIGSRLTRALLQKGLRVKVLDVQQGLLREESSPNLEFIGIGSNELHGGMVDKVLVEQAVESVDVVYHLAINWDGATWAAIHPLTDLFDINIRGSLNLLEAAKSHGVKHFLFASSCAVYGEAGSLTVDEETICKPETSPQHLSAYGIMKLTTEKLCLLYHRRYGLPVTSFRIEVVFSEDESQLSALSSKYIDKLLNGENIEVIDGEGCSSVHVDEVVDAFLLATLNDKAYGNVFNISNPATYITHRELYQFIIQLIGSKSKIKVIPSGQRISCVPESIEKIQRILGWRPQETKEDLKKAVAETVRLIAGHHEKQ
jgi:nucleoside-diphosphate-sugar epimerase